MVRCRFYSWRLGAGEGVLASIKGRLRIYYEAGSVMRRCREFISFFIFAGAMLLRAAPSADSSDRSIQGIVEAYRFADISPEISGRIVEISVQEGKIANKGDTIVKIEYTEDLLATERARMIAENKADLKVARLKMENAKLEYDATKLVYDSTNAVSAEELWRKKFQFESASAEFEQLSGQKDREQIEYRMAQSRLRTHFIIAPYRCIVGSIKMHEWEHCKAAEPLVSIVDASRCRFVAYVPIHVAKHLTTGKQARMKIDSKTSALPKTGIVEFISPGVDPSSNLFTVKIRFENSNGSVNPGVSGYLLIDE
jgi:RND family efflux transporter MFP subunit